ncbi:uncharacterized protein DS421_10g311840 [Arachis hypogaea]|nr:uncharacterized protein DS421_10g311830 [Arachis hypogaea]QHO17399.1 uncharacterized protein DS421_10g311840 [Arachis hypogaea]
MSPTALLSHISPDSSVKHPGKRSSAEPLRQTSVRRNFSVRAPIAAPFAATRPPRRALHFYRNNFTGSN